MRYFLPKHILSVGAGIMATPFGGYIYGLAVAGGAAVIAEGTTYIHFPCLRFFLKYQAVTFVSVLGSNFIIKSIRGEEYNSADKNNAKEAQGLKIHDEQINIGAEQSHPVKEFLQYSYDYFLEYPFVTSNVCSVASTFAASRGHEIGMFKGYQILTYALPAYTYSITAINVVGYFIHSFLFALSNKVKQDQPLIESQQYFEESDSNIGNIDESQMVQILLGLKGYLLGEEFKNEENLQEFVANKPDAIMKCFSGDLPTNTSGHEQLNVIKCIGEVLQES